MDNENGKFRFTYFTDKYDETLEFYQHKLGLRLEHSWDRDADDKGALFKAGVGLIEVLLFRSEEERQSAGLDYRSPQGVFMCIQVWNVDELFEQYRSKGVSFNESFVI